MMVFLCVFFLQLIQSLHVLSHHILFHNLSSPQQILALFPESFHSSLKNLITRILLENRSVLRLAVFIAKPVPGFFFPLSFFLLLL